MHFSIYGVFYSQHFHQDISAGIPEGNGLIQEYKNSNVFNRRYYNKTNQMH
jgi:hypothetical protein